MSRVAVVTGGASGFGAAISKKLASKGVHVIVADIAEANGNRVVEEIKNSNNGSASFFQLDVTKREDWEALVQDTVARFRGISILVNNAGGTYPSKPVLETTQADFYKCIDLNLLSIFHSVHTVLPLLRTAAGEGTNSSMVNIASTGGIRARPGLTWYSASKAACITATQTLSQEFAAEQRINCVCPVLGNTPLRDAFIGQASADEYRKSIPLGRFAEPEDIADAVWYLCSDEATFITGIILPVDGGRTA